MNFKNKYIGKPTYEIRVNLNLFDDKATLGQIITELERQDQQHNTIKSYGIEVK